jgi:predicted RNase H-like nuclease
VLLYHDGYGTLDVVPAPAVVALFERLDRLLEAV